MPSQPDPNASTSNLLTAEFEDSQEGDDEESDSVRMIQLRHGYRTLLEDVVASNDEDLANMSQDQEHDHILDTMKKVH